MHAKDIMTTSVVTVTPDTPVPAIARLLLERRISGVPVVDAGGRLVGIVTESDLMRRPEIETERSRPWWLQIFTGHREAAEEYTKSHGSKAGQVMTHPVVTVEEDTPVGDIAVLLEERRIKRVPVVRDGKLVGIVSRANLLQGLVADHARASVAGRPVGDREIRGAVMAELERQPWLTHRGINVIVVDGVVQLWGLVESEEERRAIRVLAENVPNVRQVVDRLGSVPLRRQDT
jgi:CBS domain-containing protein